MTDTRNQGIVARDTFDFDSIFGNQDITIKWRPRIGLREGPPTPLKLEEEYWGAFTITNPRAVISGTNEGRNR